MWQDIIFIINLIFTKLVQTKHFMCTLLIFFIVTIDNNPYDLLGALYVPGTMLGILHLFSQKIPTKLKFSFHS